MAESKTASNNIVISKEIWEWAKTHPAFAELIEILEDLEDLRKAKSERGKPLSISDVIARYERVHGTKLNV
ncbi:hypothetical protein IBX73_03955 [candidate division WOR-3 bacterium]|nr:hypothetical protein [candidate division WOR-3 bacterium]